jgi:hypothetical protein
MVNGGMYVLCASLSFFVMHAQDLDHYCALPGVITGQEGFSLAEVKRGHRILHTGTGTWGAACMLHLYR